MFIYEVLTLHYHQTLIACLSPKAHLRVLITQPQNVVNLSKVLVTAAFRVQLRPKNFSPRLFSTPVLWRQGHLSPLAGREQVLMDRWLGFPATGRFPQRRGAGTCKAEWRLKSLAVPWGNPILAVGLWLGRVEPVYQSVFKQGGRGMQFLPLFLKDSYEEYKQAASVFVWHNMFYCPKFPSFPWKVFIQLYTFI